MTDGTDANTDFFAITTDTAGFSGNTVFMTAYDHLGGIVGTLSYVEAQGGVRLEALLKHTKDRPPLLGNLTKGGS